MVPVERIELPTFGLQNRCSTAELNRLKAIDRISVGRIAASVYGRGPGRVNRCIPCKTAFGPPRMPDCQRDPSAARYGDDLDLQSLRKENAQLRALVVQLSSLVIKTIADQK
jgi:hypothetical protein